MIEKSRSIVILLIIVAVGALIFGVSHLLPREKEKGNKEPPTHSPVVVKPYEPLDGIRGYFGEIGWAGTTSLRSFVKYRFGGDVLSNLTKVRFDLPETEAYKNNPNVQYYRPAGMGETLPPLLKQKELNSDSSIHYTFANKYAADSKREAEITKRWKSRGVNSKEATRKGLDTHVTAVITYVREEMCVGAEEHRVGLLPWPQKPTQEEVILFQKMRACYKHPDGWYYYIFPAYLPGYLDVLAYQKHLNKIGE